MENIASLLFTSLLFNLIFFYLYRQSQKKCIQYEELLGRRHGDKLPSSKEIMKTYYEKKLPVYGFYAIFPFLEKIRRKLIEKGEEGIKVVHPIRNYSDYNY